jgi:hypothetical protein
MTWAYTWRAGDVRVARWVRLRRAVGKQAVSGATEPFLSDRSFKVLACAAGKIISKWARH